MLKKILISGVFTLCFYICFAQTDSVKVQKTNYYLGVQVNQLFRQIISLNNNAAENTNPYLFSAGMNSVKSGWGLETGFGYTLQTVKNTSTPATTTNTSNINDLFFRVGFGRRLKLGRRFEAGYWLDLTGAYQNDKTTNVTVDNSGGSGITITSTSNVSTTSMIYGGGPRLTFSYHIGERILIGTESDFYFTANNEKQNISVVTEETFGTLNLPPVTQTTNSNPSSTSMNFKMSLPVALFLTVKF